MVPPLSLPQLLDNPLSVYSFSEGLTAAEDGITMTGEMAVFVLRSSYMSPPEWIFQAVWIKIAHILNKLCSYL